MGYKVVIAEDHYIHRKYFEYEIQSLEGYETAASFDNAQDAVNFCIYNKPDLVLMDIMPGAFEAVSRIRQARSETGIILVTSVPEVSYIGRAKKSGAHSFWYKEDPSVPLSGIMEKTMGGSSVYPKKPLSVPIGNIRSDEFTAREIQVLRELIGGNTNRDIAVKLNISEMTVRNHIINMMQKTGFKTRTELAVQVSSAGIVIKE